MQWHRSSTVQAASEAKARLLAQTPRLRRPDSPYVSSDKCRACHPGAYHSWHRTYHRTMTQLAQPENVLGDFSGATVESAGLEYRVFRRGDEFWAEMPDPDLLLSATRGNPGKRLEQVLDLDRLPRVEQQVVMTTGSHHYQTYWVASRQFPGVMHTLPLVYLPHEAMWIPREAAFMMPPDHAERLVTIWNDHCIKCHSTGWNPKVSGPRSFDTEVGELGIACEACHGPAQDHIEKYRNPLTRYASRLTNDGDPRIVNPATLDHVRSSQICGQCHGVHVWRDDQYGARYMFEGDFYRPGDDLNQFRECIAFPDADASPAEATAFARNREFFRERWWDDGSILAAGREYTAMQRPPCYQQGTMSCLSCHSMHGAPPVDQLAPGMDGSASCTQCHKEPRFNAEVTTHTHHAADSHGSNCLNCHMPHTSYGLFSGIRNHTLTNPSIRQSVEHGTPNACNLCHLDQTLAWTQDHLAQWYGHERLDLDPTQRDVAAAVAWLLQGDAAQRAIAAWHFGWGPAQQASGAIWMPPLVAQLLDDPYGVVRRIAALSLANLPGYGQSQFNFLAPAERRRELLAEIVRNWSSGGPAPPASPTQAAATLRQPDGRLDAKRLQALVSNRNDRPVRIKE